MLGLTVRWSLAGTADGTLERLRGYVEEDSHGRFAGLDGLRFKSWRAVDGDWFEGSYVFVTDDRRDDFQQQFTHNAAVSRVSQIVGAPPVLIEPCEIIAVVRGPAGFRSAARFEN